VAGSKLGYIGDNINIPDCSGLLQVLIFTSSCNFSDYKKDCHVSLEIDMLHCHIVLMLVVARYK